MDWLASDGDFEGTRSPESVKAPLQSPPRLPLRITAIEQDATRQLTNGVLSSAEGGSVLTRNKHGKLIPERAVYRVTLYREHPSPDRAHAPRVCVGASATA